MKQVVKLFIHLSILTCLVACHSQIKQDSAFPAKIPMTKPDRPLSAAMHRMYDQWNPHEDHGNELYSNFKYTDLKGLERSPYISRRDPSKIIRIKGKYYVWYTYRNTPIPVGPQKATDKIPSFDWDLAEIWYATSKDGYTWEEQGPALRRPQKPQYGWRSVTTTDILIWEGKYYLYYQAFNEIPGLRSDRAAVAVASADSPDGPWTLHHKPIIDFGKEGEWDCNAIHDPYPIVFKDKIYIYYKGSPGRRTAGNIIRAQGVAMADSPMGPFKKSALNPVINSGHEASVFPWKKGVAAIVSIDGPEKNTIQYSDDGENFHVVSNIQMPPVAPGPFIADAFANKANGRGITWGLSHVNFKGSGVQNNCGLLRFDCDLSLDVNREIFKRNNLRFNIDTYLQNGVALPKYLKHKIQKEAKKIEQDTIVK